jgi:hypothetical protein
MVGLVWWYKPVIPALRRLRQEDLNFEATLSCTEKHCFNKRGRMRKKEQEREKK